MDNTNSISTTSDKRDDDKVSCNICDGPNASMRYGAVCCPGCAAFFARTMRKAETEPYRCPMPVPCSTAFQVKRRCKACRFRKCLDKRMRLPLKYSDSDGDASSMDSDLLVSDHSQPVQRNAKRGKKSAPSASVSSRSDNGTPSSTFFREDGVDGESGNMGGKVSVPSARLSGNITELDETFMERVDKVLTENSGFLDSLLGTSSARFMDGEI